MEQVDGDALTPAQREVCGTGSAQIWDESAGWQEQRQPMTARLL